MSFISYAQNFEDVMLWRALKDVTNGFYIDVGANDPTQDSVTKAFYDKGWQGINIEPSLEWFEKLKKDRPRDINLQLAAGAKPGTVLFYDIPNTGLSTIDKNIAEEHEKKQGYKNQAINVPVDTLTNICKEQNVTAIHFLKIDTEGSEKSVLEGIDFTKIRPWIVVVESTLPNTQIESHETWEPLLLKNQYDFVYFDGLNRFYLAHEKNQLKEKFNSPPNCFDNFSLSQSQGFCKITIEKTTAQLRETINQTQFKAEQAEALCYKLYNSKSWRFTYPLRKIALYFQKIRKPL